MKLVICGSVLALCSLVQARTITVESGTEELSENLLGDEELVKTGAGTLVLTGNNSGWTGKIDIQEGVIKSTFARLGKTGELWVGENGTLTLTGTDPISDKPTRPLHLAGAVRSDGFLNYGSDPTKLNTYWYPFVDVTLEGDAHMDAMVLVGWGSLHMNEHRLDIDGTTGDAHFTKVVIDGNGVISKSGGYLIFDAMQSDFGAGLTLEIGSGCTAELLSCKGVKCLCPVKVMPNTGKSWLMVQGCVNVREDNIWAGPIEIGAGSVLMSWTKDAKKDLCVIEGPISGDGSFSSASSIGLRTLLRGGASITTTAPLLVDAGEILVEDAAILPLSGGVTIKTVSNLSLIGCTEAQIQAVVAKTEMGKTQEGKPVSGRVVIVAPDGKDVVYNGPFDRDKLWRYPDGGSVSSTNAITDALLSGIASLNRGLWYVGGDPTATASLGNWYYQVGPVCLRDAGTLNFSGWVAGEVYGRGNVNPSHLRVEGDTTMTVGGGIYVGRGGEYGIGKMEIRDVASVTGRWLIGFNIRDRGGLYLSGGQMTMEGLDDSKTYNALGYTDYEAKDSSSTGCIIQRGGTNTINALVYGGWGPHTYGAYVLHGGAVVQKKGARMTLAGGGRFHFYMDGGTYVNENTECGGEHGYPFNVNAQGKDTGCREGSFTLAGDAAFTSNCRVETWFRKSLTHYNLNGGVLTCPLLYIYDDVHKGYGTVHLSFNGGTWKTPLASGQLFGYLNENAGPTSFVIYEGGATIDTCGTSRQVDRSVDAPTGLGVKSVTLPEKIGGIAIADWKAVGPLPFWFEGGNGSADAMIDFDERTGETKGVKVLCSGFGYTEAPKAYVVSPDGLSTNECFVEMFEPKGGDFTKRGLGTLHLNMPNSYTGRTIIEEGELHWGDAAGCVPPAPDVTIAAGADLWPPKGVILDTLRGNGISWYDQSVTNRLYVNYADVTNGTHLTVKGGALNLVDAKVVVPDLADLSEDAKSVTLIEAEKGITGTFSFEVDEAVAARWKVVHVGNRLRLVNCSHGMVLLVR